MLALTDAALPSAAVTTLSHCVQITSLILRQSIILRQSLILRPELGQVLTNWSESITDILLMLLTSVI